MSNNTQLKYKKNYIKFNLLTDCFSLGTKTVRYFHGINITLFLKNKDILEMCTIVCSEIPFSKNSYHIETSKLIALQIS